MKINYRFSKSKASMLSVLYCERIFLDNDAIEAEDYNDDRKEVCSASELEDITLDESEENAQWFLLIRMRYGAKIFTRNPIWVTPCPDHFNVDGYSIDDEGDVYACTKDRFGFERVVRADEVKEVIAVPASELPEYD